MVFWFLTYRYLGYRKDQKNDNLPVVTETIMAFFCLMQCVLLGTFAAILGAHRSEILEKHEQSAPSIGQDSFGETPYTRSWEMICRGRRRLLLLIICVQR